jgi:hypothetical protein
MWWDSVKRHSVAFGVFLLLACLMVYWPLFHLGTHIPSDIYLTDYFHFNWNYWWMRHALAAGQTIYQTNYVLFPYVTNLGYHTLMPFWYPAWALLEPAIDTLAAMQVIMLLATALTGYAAFLLLRREGVSAGWSLVGGVIYQLSPAMYAALLVTTPNYLNFFWPPVQLLIWGQVTKFADVPSRRWRGIAWAVVQGLALYAMLMTDTQFVLYTALLLVPYGLLTLVRAGGWAARGRLALLGMLAIGIALLLWWFAGPLPYMLSFDRAALAPPPPEEAYRIPFPGGYVSRDMNYTYVITLGWLVLPLVFVSLLPNLFDRRRPRDRRWFWLLVALPPLFLSLGASITVGDAVIPMPYRWLHEALGGMLRSAHRFGMAFILPAMIFVGLTWTPILRTWPVARRLVPVVLLLLALLDARLFWPMPIQPVVPYYEFYERIGAEQGVPYDDEVILEVPVAAGSGEIWVGEFDQLKTQFYGITHGKRMVNGLISRVPIDHFWSLRTDDPLLSWLGQRRFLEPELARAELERIIFDWPVGYIIVHQDLIGREGPTVQEVIGWLNAQADLLCPVWVEGDAVVYRTAWHPDGCPPRTPPEVEPGVYQIDVGSPGDEQFIGWGWHWPEAVSGLTLRWTGEYPQTHVYVDLPPGDYDISLSAQSFWEARKLRLLLNGVPLEPGEVALPPGGLATYTFHAPADLVGDGQHLTLTLDYDGWVVPLEAGQSADTRKLALAVDWVRFEQQSE